MDAVIFDLDGVLVDSEPAHGRAIREVCAEHGVAFEIEEAVGLPDGEAFALAWRRAGHEIDEELRHALLARKSARFDSMVRSGQIRAFPGAVDLVRWTARATRCGVCSAGLGTEVHAQLELIDLAGFVRAVISAQDVELPKPAPEPYLRAAEALAVDVQRCIAIEDSPTGVASARAAGCYVIALEHSMRGADLALAHEIAPAIGSLRPRLEELLTQEVAP